MGVVKVIALVLLIVLAVGGLAIGALRLRKLHLDDVRALERRRVERPDVPPSPYATATGIHILNDGEEPESMRPEPARPRLDPEAPYVFSDVSPYDPEQHATYGARHDDRWALERSFHRSRLTAGSVRALVVASILVVTLIIVGAVLRTTSHSGTSTTTTTSTTSTTTTIPHALGVTRSRPELYGAISLSTKANTPASSRHAS
jgi:hypothetical protein